MLFREPTIFIDKPPPVGDFSFIVNHIESFNERQTFENIFSILEAMNPIENVWAMLAEGDRNSVINNYPGTKDRVLQTIVACLPPHLGDADDIVSYFYNQLRTLSIHKWDAWTQYFKNGQGRLERASEHLINGLFDSHNKVHPPQANDTCNMCHQPLDNSTVCVIPCNHMFHEQCIRNHLYERIWSHLTHWAKCPVCNIDIDIGAIRKARINVTETFRRTLATVKDRLRKRPVGGKSKMKRLRNRKRTTYKRR